MYSGMLHVKVKRWAKCSSGEGVGLARYCSIGGGVGQIGSCFTGEGARQGQAGHYSSDGGGMPGCVLFYWWKGWARSGTQLIEEVGWELLILYFLF